MEINIQTTKIDLIRWLTNLEDKFLIQKIVELKIAETADWWNEISEKEKSSIHKGILDSEQGRLNSHSDAQKIYEKWL
jgi:hypothetical protein